MATLADKVPLAGKVDRFVIFAILQVFYSNFVFFKRSNYCFLYLGIIAVFVSYSVKPLQEQITKNRDQNTMAAPWPMNQKSCHKAIDNRL